MGLTVHYDLTFSGAASKAKAKLQEFRALASKIAKVGSLVEYKGEASDFNNARNDHPNRWMLIQASGHFQFTHNGTHHGSVSPLHMIAFSTDPGENCEPANFGLCKFPATVERFGKKIRTGLGTGWHWSSFCKTCYSTDFLKSHVLVITLLDLAQQMGLLKKVMDEGDYWPNRNLEELAKEGGASLEQVAAMAGALKDMASKLGQAVQSPV